jgi:uncharacterized protein (DUF2147 family)
LASTITFSQTIEGTWQPEGKDAIFKIFEENGKYYGQLIGSNDSNQDEQIKEKDVIILLRDLQKESNTNFCCGTFFVPEKKRELSAAVTLTDENTIVIKVSKGWFSKSITWKRV